jgi:hypothetical protein
MRNLGIPDFKSGSINNSTEQHIAKRKPNMPLGTAQRISKNLMSTTLSTMQRTALKLHGTTCTNVQRITMVNVQPTQM